VSRGFSQQEEEYYDETIVPVIRRSIYRKKHDSLKEVDTLWDSEGIGMTIAIFEIEQLVKYIIRAMGT